MTDVVEIAETIEVPCGVHPAGCRESHFSNYTVTDKDGKNLLPRGGVRMR